MTAASAEEDHGFEQRLKRLDPHLVDALFGIVFTAVAVTITLTGPGPGPGMRHLDVPGVVLLLLMTLPLVLVRTNPIAVLAAIAAATVVAVGFDYYFVDAGGFAIAAALFATTALCSHLRGFLAALVVSSGLIVVYAFQIPRGNTSILQAMGTWGLLTGVWIAGTGVKLYRDKVWEARERARVERERAELFRHDVEMHTQEAIELERSRIARELHDVVGHALNVVVLQAGAARRVFDKRPEAARDALASIESAGRQALVDIERMLGLLRAEDSERESLMAEAGVAQIPSLVEQVREAGLPVELLVDNACTELPASVDRSAYRIIQEALTNTLKHAGPAHARVSIVCTGDWLEVEATDDGRGVPAEVLALGTFSGGRGIVGMRERVLLFGGELEVGPRAEGGYRVHARLPLQGGLR